ncbi:MAG: VOC family protein [Phycisphaerae bacterium]
MPNPLCHFELMSNQPEQCKEFYGKVFDWTFDDDSMPDYTLVNTGAEPTGGIFLKPSEAPSACANLYFSVDDIDETLAKVAELGGTVIVPKTAIPGVGHFAMFADPEGITIGILKAGGR